MIDPSWITSWLKKITILDRFFSIRLWSDGLLAITRGGTGTRVAVGEGVNVGVGDGVNVGVDVKVSVGKGVDVLVGKGNGVDVSVVIGVKVAVAVGERQNMEPVAITVLVVSRTSNVRVPKSPLVLILKV